MADILKPLGLAALVALAAPAFAQDTTSEEAPAAETPAANPDLDMGQPVGGGDQPQVESYIDEVFGDWQRECLRFPDNDGPDPCQITQFLREEPEGSPVGKVSIGRLPEEQEATAGSMIIVPLGVLLTQQMTVGVDSATPKRYPFRFCDPNGCVAQIGYTAAEVEAFKAGAEAFITVVPIAAPDQEVELAVSLNGFTDAWNSLETPVPPQAPTAAE